MAPLALQQQALQGSALQRCGSRVAARLTAAGRLHQQRVVRVNAQQQVGDRQGLAQRVAAGTAAALIALGGVDAAALANEFDLLTTATPTVKYVLDDADVLSKTVKQSINERLRKLEEETGFRVEVATVRKLEFENDAFAFGDKLVERWYPKQEDGTNKGILLIVTTAKDGAVTGGPKFMNALTDDVIDGVVAANIPVFTEQEKYNETVTSSINRLEAVLRGQEDPGGPVRPENARKRTYKTKEETDKTRNVTGTIVLTLLFIAFVVPMLQFFGYTAKD